MRIILTAGFLAATLVFGFTQEKFTTPATPSTASALATATLPAAASGTVILAFTRPDPLLAIQAVVNSKVYKAPFRTEGASTSVVAQEQVTIEDLNVLLAKAPLAAVAVKEVEKKTAELKSRWDNLLIKKNTHDANQCIFPKGREEICAEYNKEAAEIDQGFVLLKAAAAENAMNAGILKSNLGLLKTRIRITALLLYRCDCEDRDREEAKACEDTCIDNANPNLKSCLDKTEFATAVCLDRLRRSKDDQ